ncbi:MAG: XRE family transcriptional regulator [Sphingobacteriales bacterium]|nr:MAG: XRE family transcriptional regulator [Sphingobacteriales bacterium]
MQHVKDPVLLKKLGQRIRRLRKEKNLSQLQLAVLMDNHAEQIGRIERGELNVTIGTLQKIAASLDTNILHLLAVE